MDRCILYRLQQGGLMLGHLWKEIVLLSDLMSDVYSLLALNGAIILYFQTGEERQSEILTSSFCWRREMGRLSGI